MTKFEKEMTMDTTTNAAGWAKAAVLLARLILALVFLMAFAFKIMDINATAGFIASAGFPLATLLAVLAALFELAIVLSLITGAYFSEMMLLGAAYVVFLAFAFHGPSHWTDDKGLEIGGFISHFPFAAGMLFAAAHGPGRLLALKRNIISRHSSIR
jgi:putative oxidoreductase